MFCADKLLIYKFVMISALFLQVKQHICVLINLN